MATFKFANNDTYANTTFNVVHPTAFSTQPETQETLEQTQKLDMARDLGLSPDQALKMSVHDLSNLLNISNEKNLTQDQIIEEANKIANAPDDNSDNLNEREETRDEKATTEGEVAQKIDVNGQQYQEAVTFEANHNTSTENTNQSTSARDVSTGNESNAFPDSTTSTSATTTVEHTSSSSSVQAEENTTENVSSGASAATTTTMSSTESATQTTENYTLTTLQNVSGTFVPTTTTTDSPTLSDSLVYGSEAFTSYPYANTEFATYVTDSELTASLPLASLTTLISGQPISNPSFNSSHYVLMLSGSYGIDYFLKDLSANGLVYSHAQEWITANANYMSFSVFTIGSGGINSPYGEIYATSFGYDLSKETLPSIDSLTYQGQLYTLTSHIISQLDNTAGLSVLSYTENGFIDYYKASASTTANGVSTYAQTDILQLDQVTTFRSFVQNETSPYLAQQNQIIFNGTTPVVQIGTQNPVYYMKDVGAQDAANSAILDYVPATKLSYANNYFRDTATQQQLYANGVTTDYLAYAQGIYQDSLSGSALDDSFYGKMVGEYALEYTVNNVTSTYITFGINSIANYTNIGQQLTDLDSSISSFTTDVTYGNWSSFPITPVINLGGSYFMLNQAQTGQYITAEKIPTGDYFYNYQAGQIFASSVSSEYVAFEQGILQDEYMSGSGVQGDGFYGLTSDTTALKYGTNYYLAYGGGAAVGFLTDTGTYVIETGNIIGYQNIGNTITDLDSSITTFNVGTSYTAGTASFDLSKVIQLDSNYFMQDKASNNPVQYIAAAKIGSNNYFYNTAIGTENATKIYAQTVTSEYVAYGSNLYKDTGLAGSGVIDDGFYAKVSSSVNGFFLNGKLFVNTGNNAFTEQTFTALDSFGASLSTLTYTQSIPYPYDGSEGYSYSLTGATFTYTQGPPITLTYFNPNPNINAYVSSDLTYVTSSNGTGYFTFTEPVDPHNPITQQDYMIYQVGASGAYVSVENITTPSTTFWVNTDSILIENQFYTKDASNQLYHQNTLQLYTVFESTLYVTQGQDAHVYSATTLTNIDGSLALNDFSTIDSQTLYLVHTQDGQYLGATKDTLVHEGTSLNVFSILSTGQIYVDHASGGDLVAYAGHIYGYDANTDLYSLLSAPASLTINDKLYAQEGDNPYALTEVTRLDETSTFSTTLTLSASADSVTYVDAGQTFIDGAMITLYNQQGAEAYTLLQDATHQNTYNVIVGVDPYNPITQQNYMIYDVPAYPDHLFIYNLTGSYVVDSQYIVTDDTFYQYDSTTHLYTENVVDYLVHQGQFYVESNFDSNIFQAATLTNLDGSFGLYDYHTISVDGLTEINVADLASSESDTTALSTQSSSDFLDFYHGESMDDVGLVDYTATATTADNLQTQSQDQVTQMVFDEGLNTTLDYQALQPSTAPLMDLNQIVSSLSLDQNLVHEGTNDAMFSVDTTSFQAIQLVSSTTIEQQTNTYMLAIEDPHSPTVDDPNKTNIG